MPQQPSCQLDFPITAGRQFVSRNRGLSVPRLPPLISGNCTITACADANPSASGESVKRWFLAILLRASRSTKFLRYRFALLTAPPQVTRCGVCIGCDPAANSQRRSTHEQQTISSRLRRHETQLREWPEELLARGWRRLASQERQGLRHRDPRGHQRQRSHRMHRAKGQTRRVSRPGQGASYRALPHFLFLLPSPVRIVAPDFGAAFSYCVAGTFRQRNAISFAARLILRFIRHMIRADKTHSKLFADNPRHVSVRKPSVFCLHSTWQGGGDPLRCILPLCRTRHVETLPVSIPSGFRVFSLLCSWMVRP